MLYCLNPQQSRWRSKFLVFSTYKNCTPAVEDDYRPLLRQPYSSTLAFIMTVTLP